MTPDRDHYSTLDLTPDASDADIKRRYRKLMRTVHPDANAHDPQATRNAARLNAAYETLGNPQRRKAYDAQHHPLRLRRRYEVWAEQPDWEDIVAANVPARRPVHAHAPTPVLEPEEIEIDMGELREQPRVRRTITITNRCACRLVGDVSTSEPWVWGPVGEIVIEPGASASFEIEVIARKVAFPGLSRVIFVAKDWSGAVPVKITGYTPKLRRSYPPTRAAYVPPRRRRAMRPR